MMLKSELKSEQKSQINSPAEDSADCNNLDKKSQAAKPDYCEPGHSESSKTVDKRKQQEFEQYLQEKKDKEQKHRNENFKMLAFITQFGINMLVPIFLCFFAGMFLDRKLGTNYIAVLLFFIGATAGFRNVYVFVKKSTKRQEKDNKFIDNGNATISNIETSNRKN